jgi:ech hydrogenase subunit A
MLTADLLGMVAPGLLGAPLLGAVALWLLPGGDRGQALRAPVTLAALVLLAAGLLAALVVAAAGPPRSVEVPFALEAAHRPVASMAWSLAPAVLALLFVAIGLRAKSRSLVALALLQAALALPAAVRDLADSAPPASVGSSLILDPLAVVLLVVSVGVGGLIVVFSLGYEPKHLRGGGHGPAATSSFLAWLLVFLAAMHLLVLADDLRLLAVGWELTTLCSYVLIGFDGDERARAAAERALAYNLFGGAALALGLLLAGPHATLSGLLTRPEAAMLPAVLGAMAVAAATKSALAPFHPWLLGAMVAAAPVSALLHASTMVKAGSYLLLRLSPAMSGAGLGLAVAVLGGFSFAMAALLALRERDLKRVLALSTVASLGLLAVAAGLGSPVALAAGVVLLVFHAAAKGLAFLVVGASEQVTGTRDLEALVGLARARPRLAAPLLLAAAAMALPPFAIAGAKWALLLAGRSDVPVALLLAVGAAANVGLWTTVVGRMIVRRPLGLAFSGRVGAWERAAIASLAIGTASGLILAAPLAGVVGDPAALVAFRHTLPLGNGWDLQAPGGAFPVGPLALVVVALGAVALALTRRLSVSPQPYLGGTNLAAGTEPVFHGARGGPRLAASGGFYWGGALPGTAGPVGLRRFVLVGGWLGVAAVVLAASLNAAGGA